MAAPTPLRFRFAGSPAVAALLALGVVLLVVALIAAALTLDTVNDDTAMVEHTLEVEAAINKVAAANEQVETGRRGFLIEPDATFARVVRFSSESYDSELAKLQSLTSDNAHQVRDTEELERLAADRARLIATMLADPAAATQNARDNSFDRDPGVLLTRRIRALTASMASEEARLLKVRNRAKLESLFQFYTIGGAALALLLVVLGAVIVLVLRYNRALAATQDRLRHANEGLEEAVGARTAELLRANQEIQRFAYIVSHDLRSPLVNVLGFTAELEESRKTIARHLDTVEQRAPALRDEATRLAIDEDLPEAIGFIRTSTEKMDRLINSILELSRQGRRPLSPEQLDLETLADGVIATLHQRAREANATVSRTTLPPLESDRMAVEQMVTNLVENAIKYRAPTRPGEIVISGERAGARVHIDVTDNGRGIDPKDHERIFELFRRSGAQDQPGEGIGLANVRALAYRLGGTIEVESQLDRGSRFRLSLPARFISTDVNA